MIIIYYTKRNFNRNYNRRIIRLGKPSTYEYKALRFANTAIDCQNESIPCTQNGG